MRAQGVNKIIALVACPNYLRDGGDEYTLLRDKAIEPYDYGPFLLDVLLEYMGAMSPINPRVEGRIEKVGSR